MLAYLPLLLAWTVAVVSPGPDFFAVLRTSAGGTRRAGLLAGFGVVTGIACWALAALAGLTAVLARYEHLYLVLRLAGAAFLVLYGLSLLRSSLRQQADAEPVEFPNTAPAGWRSWRFGLLTNLSNPKAVVFFGALFAGLLPPTAGLEAKAVLLLAMIGLAIGWFALVAALASVPAARIGYQRARRVIDTLTGGLFVAIGGVLALE